MTDQNLILTGLEKEKAGPNKGKLVYVIKRKIPYSNIVSVSMRYYCELAIFARVILISVCSTKSDGFVIIHVAEYDSLLSSAFKTELVAVLYERYNFHKKQSLPVQFKDEWVLSLCLATFLIILESL